MVAPEPAGLVISQTKECPLKGMPAEVNAYIYQYVFEETPAGKTPPLLVALRQEKDLYGHALEIYYDTTMVRMGPNKKGSRNSWALNDLSKLTLLSLKRLEVEFELKKGAMGMYETYPNVPTNVEIRILSAINLREVTFNFRLLPRENFPIYPSICRNWALHFLKLKKLTMKAQYINSEPRTVQIPGVEQYLPHPAAINAINNGLGVCGKLERVTGLNESCTNPPFSLPPFSNGSSIYSVNKPNGLAQTVSITDVWFWEAEPGRTLTWN